MLLVDDCHFQRILTVGLLARWGICPVVASGGQEAIHHDSCRDFDIILMDIQMPEMDGFEATRLIREAQRLRQCARRIPVVAHTASPLPLDEASMARSGFDDAVKKPCDASIMSKCLLRWCADKFNVPRSGARKAAHA